MSKIAFYLILLFHTSLFAVAQFEPTRNFSVKDGLPSGVVYDCLQDKQGFMWFATAAGLARFDGANFKVFTTEDGLTNNEVLQIALDPDGSIWIFPFGTSACIYDPSSQKLYNENNYDELKKLKIQAAQLFARNSAAGLIVIGNQKAFFLKNKKIDTLETRHISDLWPVTQDSMIFMGYRQSYLSTKQNKIDLNFDKPDSLLYIYVARSIDWGRWKIFFNSRTPKSVSLYQFTYDRTIEKVGDFFSRFPLNNITKFGARIYLPTIDGVYVTDSTLITREYFFAGKNISKVFVDKNGNEWLCSLSGEGVYMRLKNEVKQYEVTSGLPYENVTTLKLIGENKLICGDGIGNIYSIDPSQKDNKPIMLKKFPESIRGIDKVKNSSIIYSSYKLLVDDRDIYDDFGAIKTVLPDTTGNLLIGSHWYLYSYDLLKDKKEKLKDARRFVALSYSEGSLYYGNNNGTFKIRDLSPFSDTTVNKNTKILREPVNHLISSVDGILWIATNTNGVAAVKNEKLIGHFAISSSQPLTSNICKKLFYDEESNSVWVATNKGINRIKYTLMNDSLYASVSSVTSSEGLNDDDVNDIYVNNGKVYAATIKGICIFNTDLLKEEVPIRITDVVIKGYSPPDSLKLVKSNYDLKYWQNNISISYAGICFTCNKKLLYQYRLLGIGTDTAWKTTNANTVEFGELKKGNYTFQVRTDSDDMQGLRFYIQPAFWQTEWFYLLVTAGILGVFYFIIKFITQQIRKREIEKTMINKRFAELEFQALQAQMNPHFVFNAMNTLQNYILKNESENASEYLAKFARLMRLFLESSRNKFIDLRNEIELLSNYIELEQARLQNSFQYRIHVDPDVEMETKIPSVMIQPFVENAILHGLRHKTGNDGLLELSFIGKGNVLECKIEDNGIGRGESAIINKTKEKLYKSQALDIIDEKISSLRVINNIDIIITTEDNVAENGEGTGTTVIIQFRLNN